MTIAVIQSAERAHGAGGPWGSIEQDFDDPTTVGNALFYIAIVTNSSAGSHFVVPAGWTEIVDIPVHPIEGHNLCVGVKVADGTETEVHLDVVDGTGTPVTRARVNLIIGEVSGIYAGVGSRVARTGSSSQTLASVTPGPGIEALLLVSANANNGYNTSSYPAGYSLVDEITSDTGSSDRLTVLANYEATTTSGAYNGTVTYVGGITNFSSAHLYFTALPVIDVDFSGDPLSGTAALAVQFTDLSEPEADVSAWAWDFGDGDTSSSQDPLHTYDEAGAYTVSLEATIDGDDYTETKIAYVVVTTDVGYVPPDPGLAIVEIYANAPGGPRWDEALWDEALWSSAGWQDVTPQSVRATVRWGSTEPEQGILAMPEAGTWALDIYDPDRVLDPSNEDGPYFGGTSSLGFPIRIRHRGVVVRTGICETIAHGFRPPTNPDTDVPGPDNGYIRATDHQATLSQAEVPPDTTLADTLWERARDAITAAGLSVLVLPTPPTGDPALIAWETGTERSAWQWIEDAARQVLHTPYIDRLNRLGFRAWASPLVRGRELADPELIDLQAIADYKGRYSVVSALDDTDVLISRSLTPTPRYGKREHRRNAQTPDAGDWAQAILEDRALPSIRWVPGEVFPGDANSVERHALIEALELVTMVDATTDPPVLAEGIVVGGSLRLFSGRQISAQWRFTFEVASIAEMPLWDSPSDPPEFLEATGGGQYLYPSI